MVVTDVLVNDSDGETKVTYRPLPDDATISGFASYEDGRRNDADIVYREAKKAFDKAEEEGKHAGLAETDGPLGFRMDLTPLAAHESRRVELSYVQSMRPLGAERSFVYPSRHAIGEAPRVFELDFSLEAGRALTAIGVESARRPHRQGGRQGSARHTRSRGHCPRDRPGRALGGGVSRSRSQGSCGQDERKRPPTWRPGSLSQDQPGRDAAGVVFVVDTSLSMAGDALDRERARRGSASAQCA